ncbi:hypothetical protein ACJX0J_037547, partial [Zea mays]
SLLCLFQIPFDDIFFILFKGVDLIASLCHNYHTSEERLKEMMDNASASLESKDGGISLCKKKHYEFISSFDSIFSFQEFRMEKHMIAHELIFSKQIHLLASSYWKIPDSQLDNFLLVEEETGIKLNIEDMVDLMTLLDPATRGRMLPSPDEWYDPAALAASSAWDVAKLRARFCCRDLHAGAWLCVSCSLDDVNLKFYIVVVDSWSDGPHAGSMKEIDIERVCC